MTADTPAAIARRLSPAQRRALLLAPPDGTHWYGQSYGKREGVRHSTFWVLVQKELVALAPPRATPLGVEVRKVLVEAGDG